MSRVRKLRSIFSVLSVGVSLAFGCSPRPDASTGHASTSPTVTPTHVDPAKSEATPAAVQPVPKFRETAKEAGLDYEWKIAGKRPLTILQTIGNGCAFLDYDNDGNLDILLVGDTLGFYKGDGKGHFTNVAAEAGLSKLKGHFLGCAVGDYDNDGFDDLYISGYGTGILLHNEAGSDGKRVFVDVTEKMGLKPQPWGASCGFADLDGDGYLDLYVGNYVDFGPDSVQLCPFQGRMSGCGPLNYYAIQGVMYHSEHGQRFKDVTKEWGIKAHGKSLGVAFADISRSGHLSLALANDLMPGDLLQNQGRHKFENIGSSSGSSLDPSGQPHAGMGIDWGDYDNDGRPDLFVTTFGNETKCLFRNEGYSTFQYASEQAGVDIPTLPYVAWGCKFFDADNDGWLDLMVANGHVQDNIDRFEKATYRQPTIFLHNLGGKPTRFQDASKSSGVDQLPKLVGRGLAVGDYDNDGLVDVLIVDSEGHPQLLHNESTVTPGGWIGFKLIGKGASNRDGYGAAITIKSKGQSWTRQCHPGGSYLSSSDPRVHFGLGDAKIEGLTIRWPDGSSEAWIDIPTGKYYTLQQGERPK